MTGFLNKIGKAASDAASMAGNKAGEMIEVGKLKNRIHGKKQETNLTMRDIGEYCYGLYEAGKIDDPRILELCGKIKSCKDEIADLEHQIQNAKDEYEAKNGMNNL